MRCTRSYIPLDKEAAEYVAKLPLAIEMGGSNLGDNLLGIFGHLRNWTDLRSVEIVWALNGISTRFKVDQLLSVRSG